MAGKKKPAPAKSPAARMGMTEAEHRAMAKPTKSGKGGMKQAKMPRRGGY